MEKIREYSPLPVDVLKDTQIERINVLYAMSLVKPVFQKMKMTVNLAKLSIICLEKSANNAKQDVLNAKILKITALNAQTGTTTIIIGVWFVRVLVFCVYLGIFALVVLILMMGWSLGFSLLLVLVSMGILI